MILCPSCQAQNRDDATYCGFCGKQCQEQCPLCQSLHPIHAAYCTKDGRHIIQTLVAQEKEKRQRIAEVERIGLEEKQRELEENRRCKENDQRLKPGDDLYWQYHGLTNRFNSLIRRYSVSLTSVLSLLSFFLIIALRHTAAAPLGLIMLFFTLAMAVLIPSCYEIISAQLARKTLGIPKDAKLLENRETWFEIALKLKPRPKGCEDLLEPAPPLDPQTLLRPAETNPNTTPPEQLLRPAKLKEGRSDC